MQISFSGRCGRLEFLMLVIFNFVVSFGIGAAAISFPLILAIFPLILLLFFSVTFQRLQEILDMRRKIQNYFKCYFYDSLINVKLTNGRWGEANGRVSS